MFILSISCEAEATALFDGPHQSFTQNLLWGVLRKIKLIEASVTLWESHGVAGHNSSYLELFRAIHSLEQSESFNWHLGASSDKLQEITFFCAIECFHHFPEPQDLGRVSIVTMVIGMRFQIID